MLANLAPLVLLGGKFISCDMLVLARKHLSYNAQAFKGCCLCVTTIVFAYPVRVSMMAEHIIAMEGQLITSLFFFQWNMV